MYLTGVVDHLILEILQYTCFDAQCTCTAADCLIHVFNDLGSTNTTSHAVHQLAAAAPSTASEDFYLLTLNDIKQVHQHITHESPPPFPSFPLAACTTCTLARRCSPGLSSLHQGSPHRPQTQDQCGLPCHAVHSETAQASAEQT